MAEGFQFEGRKALVKWAYYADPGILRARYDPLHPMPIAHGVTPNYIDQNGDYLWEVIVGPTVPDEMTVNVVERSAHMRDINCDGCSRRHNTIRENWRAHWRYRDRPHLPHPHAHCSANRPGETPFLDTLPKLPQDHYILYGLDSRRVRLDGVWKLMGMGGTLVHSSMTLYLKRVRLEEI
jgi:hypothetical protein